MASKDIAIIGGGASGLLCAITCAQKGLRVHIYEQNNKLAKKILVSGNGHCNITNTNLCTQSYFSQNPTFVEDALKRFGYKESKKFMNELGIIFDETEDGRVYPLSHEAKNVVHILQAHAEILGVTIHYNTKITTLTPLLQKYDAVVLATGSPAASHLGGCEDGALLAQECNHTIHPFYPSLVQLESDDPALHAMAGVKLVAEVTLFVNGVAQEHIQGDILFTNYGISGLAILDISQHASIALEQYYCVDIALKLLPEFTAQQLAHHIQQYVKKLPKHTITTILKIYLPTKVTTTLLKKLSIDPETPIQRLNVKQIKNIANTIQNWRFAITQTHGFKHAEVCGGGIDTTQIDPVTFQSKYHNKLYCIGEVVDVVGKRGGFNFAFAWASGYLAAQAIIKS